MSLLGTTGDVEELAGDREWKEYSSRVQAVFDMWGPTSFLKMNDFPGEIDHDAPDSPESFLIGAPIQENDALCALANPITYVDSGDPPFLILHGDNDPLVPHCQSEMLHHALHEHGVPSRLVIVPGAGHGRGLFERKYFQMMTAFFREEMQKQ